MEMVGKYHSPICRTFANVQNEPADYLLSLRSMRDFGVKLDTEKGF
jgi:hypothetical protein